jgi:hypothetical protein
MGPTPFHRHYLALVAHIEREFPVAQWRSGDVEIWPLARMDLYLDMFWANAGGEQPAAPPLAWRALNVAAMPLTNVWRSRHDRAHHVMDPKPAHAIFLGDGVSLDYVENAWQDRYSEPLIAAFERRGLDSFVMQDCDLSRLPWRRPTFAANLIARKAMLRRFKSSLPVDLPQHERVLKYIASDGVAAPSLAADKLARRARSVSAAADAFERVLEAVQPTLAFVVTYYAGLGPAFLLACRRQGVLSVDLQHCPQLGAHKAYQWSAVPKCGYGTLPAVFWNWTQRDAADIGRWTSRLAQPWHRSVHGGHTQLGSYLTQDNPAIEQWDQRFAAIGNGAAFEREILVALQPIGGYRSHWDALADQILSAPGRWRWWIRRHPAAAAYQDAEYRRLVSLGAPNVIVDASSSLPLPVLLRHVSVVVSRFSGAATEGAMLGVPAVFLSEEARGQFSDLIDRGLASITDISALNSKIAGLPATVARAALTMPDLDETLRHLETSASDYARLCAKGNGSE